MRTTREQCHRTEPRPVLQTEHLSRIVSATRLVDDVSISVREGEILAVIGPSGAGKSSFLRLLNRLDEPTRGTVYLAGQDYRQLPPRELRRRVGLITQIPFLRAQLRTISASALDSEAKIFPERRLPCSWIR